MIVLRKELKKANAEIQGGLAKPETTLTTAFKALDRAARKNAIPKKRADRKKSRLALALNRAAKAAATPKG
jgi:ribosomal protein S20